MFSAADAIAELESALALVGQDIVIKLVTSGVPGAGATFRALVRGFLPAELVGDVEQNDRKVILAPTGLSPMPVKDDKAVIAGRMVNIESDAEEIYMAGVLVRVELRVRG